MNLAEVEEAIEEAQDLVRELTQKKYELLGRHMFKCFRCGKRSRVSGVTLEIRHDGDEYIGHWTSYRWACRHCGWSTHLENKVADRYYFSFKERARE